MRRPRALSSGRPPTSRAASGRRSPIGPLYNRAPRISAVVQLNRARARSMAAWSSSTCFRTPPPGAGRSTRRTLPRWFATLGEAEQAALRQATPRDARIFLHDRYHRVRPLFARRSARSAATPPRRAPRCQARGARRGASARPRGRSGSRARAARRRRAPPTSPARRRGAAAAVGIAAASSAASISARERDRLVGVLRARLDEDAVHRRVVARAARPRPHIATRPLSASSSASRAVQTPASIPMPRSASRSASSRQPSSERFSETRSGRSVQPAISARPRVDVAARDPQPGRERELDAGQRRAARAPPRRCAPGRASRGRRRSRGWACSETAPARDARARVRRQLLRRARDARLAVAVQAGLEEPCHRGGHRGQQGRAQQERPARADPRDQRERGREVADEPAGGAERVQPPGDVARGGDGAHPQPDRPRRQRAQDDHRRQHEHELREQRARATRPASPRSRPAAGSPAAGSARRAPRRAAPPAPAPRACGWRSASRPPTQ